VLTDGREGGMAFRLILVIVDTGIFKDGASAFAGVQVKESFSRRREPSFFL